MQVVFDCHYLRRYEKSSRRFDVLIQVTFVLVTLLCVALLTFWKRYPIVWSVTIFISQVLTAFSRSFPFPKRIIVAKYMINDTERLKIEMDYMLLSIYNEKDDKKLNSWINHYKIRRTAIDERYDARALFPQKKRFLRKTDLETNEEFMHRIPPPQ